NLPSSSPDSSSSAGVTRPAPVRSPPPCPSSIPCSRPASRLPHDSSKHNFLDKCPSCFFLSPTATLPCPNSGPPPASATGCSHRATAWLPAPGSRPSRLQLLQRSDDLGFAVLADRHRLFPFPSSDIIHGLVRKTGIRSIQPGKPTQN